MNNTPSPYNKTVKFAKITAAASAALAAVIALTYFFALRRDFDYSIGHFERGSALFYTLVVAIIASAALPAVLSVYSKKKASITSLPEPAGTPVFLAIFASVMAIASFGAEIISLTSQREIGKLALIAAIGLVAVAVGAFSVTSEKMRTSALAQIALPVSALAMAVRILDAYFDQTLVLNSPVRHITMLAELSVMFLLLSEARLSFGIEKTERGDTARKAPLPSHLFANNVCAALAIGFSAGALMYELIPGGADAATVVHPSNFRLALYLTLGALALTRALTVQRIAGEYIPSPLEEAKKKKDASEPTPPAESEEIQSEKE